MELTTASLQETTRIRLRLPARTALLYTAFSVSWIILSDLALDWLVRRSPGLIYLGLVKGVVFVLVTAFLLYKLLGRELCRLEEAETKLRSRDERWRMALEGVGDGVWEYNGASSGFTCSRKSKAMLGYTGEEIGQDAREWRALIHPDDAAGAAEAMRRYVAGNGASYWSEFRIRARDGSYRWICERGSRVGQVGEDASCRIIGTHSDITEQKLYAAKTSDALALTEAMLGCTPVGVIAYAAKGPAAIANESAARILGVNREDLLRQNFREIPSWRPWLLENALHALETRQEVVHGGRIVSTSGKPLWIEAHFVPFHYNEALHLLVIVNDQTAGHLALERLKLMQAAVQAAPVGWVVTDSNGRIESVNRRFTTITGYEEEEVLGHTPRVLKSGRHSSEFYGKLWQAINRGEVWSGEMINQRKDGKQYHEYNTIAPLRGADGAISHFVAIKQDITEQVELEMKLSRAQRMESIGMLAAGIVHDLNNMLAPIMLALGMIREQHSDPETLEHVQVMELAARRGAAVLRQVLTFARGVEGGRSKLDVGLLLKEVAQMARETFPREIRISLELAPDLRPADGILSQLHQVLLNLAVNARDAMPGGGVLTLHAENLMVDEARAARQITPAKPGVYVRMGIRDTGSGISPEVLEHMFEPFFSTKPRDKGTGLGLSTVFGIVRSHQGFIEVETEQGRGTDICVLLPATESGEVAAGSAPKVEARILGDGRRVLVVDDEAAIRQITCRILEKRGFRVTQATDGEEGLARFIAESAGFSAAILDLMMPKMDGYRLAEEIRRRAPSVPILCTTGMSNGSQFEKGAVLRLLGVHTLLSKPCTEAELLTALQRELG